MSELITFIPTPEHFGVFWKYIQEPSITDIDYNGQSLWVTDLKKDDMKQKKR